MQILPPTLPSLSLGEEVSQQKHKRLEKEAWYCWDGASPSSCAAPFLLCHLWLFLVTRRGSWVRSVASRLPSLCWSKEKENLEWGSGIMLWWSFISWTLIWILILFHTLMRERRFNDNPNKLAAFWAMRWNNWLVNTKHILLVTEDLNRSTHSSCLKFLKSRE